MIRIQAAPSENVLMGQRINELAGFPCNRRKHLGYNLQLFRSRQHHSAAGEHTLVETYAVAEQRPDSGRQLMRQDDFRHLPLPQLPPACIYRRHITKSLVKIYFYVDRHRVLSSLWFLCFEHMSGRYAFFHPI